MTLQTEEKTKAAHTSTDKQWQCAHAQACMNFWPGMMRILLLFKTVGDFLLLLSLSTSFGDQSVWTRVMAVFSR